MRKLDKTVNRLFILLILKLINTKIIYLFCSVSPYSLAHSSRYNPATLPYSIYPAMSLRLCFFGLTLDTLQ